MFDKPFISYLVVRICLSLASTVLSVTIGWHLYQATADPFDLALVGLMQILPVVALFIVTGWVVDHFPRKRILILCGGLELLVFLGLALSLRNGIVDRYAVFTLVFLNGCARAFISPALQAVLPNIVRPEDLSRAVAISTTAWTAALTASPLLAGLLIGAMDFHAYWVMVALAVLALVFMVPLPQLVIENSPVRGLRQLVEGIGFVFTNPIVLPSISLDLLIVLGGSVIALLPIFAVDVLRLGPEGLGLLRAMPALGAVIAGLVLSRMGAMRNAGLWLFAALLVFSCSILVFALSAQLWLSLAALFIYGASDVVSVNIRSTLIQLATPDALRGRVSAVNSLFIATSNDLGDFRAGAVAAAIGTVPAVLAGAGMAFLVSVGGYLSCRRLRALDRLEDAQYAPPAESTG